MSSTTEVSTLLQNWTVWTVDRGSGTALKVKATSVNVLLISPSSALNGVLIRFAKAVRRLFKVGNLWISSFKGPVQESGGDRLGGGTAQGILARSPKPGILPTAELTPPIAMLGYFEGYWQTTKGSCHIIKCLSTY
jgi:hypothetical protein